MAPTDPDLDIDDPRREPVALRCSYRGPDDDFFCLRYQVWYPSFDCAIRTKHQTFPGCLACEQGRFNLRRHADELRQRRPPATSGRVEP